MAAVTGTSGLAGSLLQVLLLGDDRLAASVHECGT